MSSAADIYPLAGPGRGEPRLLDGVVLKNIDFDRLLLGPGLPRSSVVTVKNCSFLDCRVAGEFRVAPGVFLDKVLFSYVASPDSMIINTQAALNEVVIKGGRRSGGLWVKPAEFSDNSIGEVYQRWVSEVTKDVSCMLDFSEYEAIETEVIGLPLSKLRWNSERHVPVYSRWRESDTWKKLDLPVTSFWSTRTKRLQTFGAAEGIFALPSPDNKRFLQTKSEMQLLIDAGLLDYTEFRDKSL